MVTFGPWFQPPDIEVPLDATNRWVTHQAQGLWSVAQSFGGPHPYDDPAAGNCSWSLARGPAVDYPGLEISGWSADLSLSGYIAPPSCPVLAPSFATIGNNAHGDTATVGPYYRAQNNLIFAGSEVRWTTLAAAWGISLRKTLNLYQQPALTLPPGVTGVEWDPTSQGSILGAKVKGALVSDPTGLDPCPLQLYAHGNSDAPPSWGPYGYNSTTSNLSRWVATTPAPQGTVVASSGGFSDTALVDISGSTIAAALAYENDYSGGFFAPGNTAPTGLVVVGITSDMLSATQPAFPGRPSLPDLTYAEIKYNGTRSWRVDGSIAIRPRVARYIYSSIPPLRWRQRDDGLGMAGAGRARSGSSLQKTLRHRGGYR